MLLGVYWYYSFPEALYAYDFFVFRPGIGGMAGGPAELTATVQAPDPAALLTAVRAVAARYPDAPVFAESYEIRLRLTLGDWSVTDYIFFVAGELEQALRHHRATLAMDTLPAGVPLLRLTQPQDDTPPHRHGGILAACSSRPGKHGAQLAALRCDCHLPAQHKAAFVETLAALCQQLDLDVCYYLDRKVDEQVNLMLFFSNGRQGVGGQPLRYTNVEALTAAVTAALAAHHGQVGLLGSYPAHYPRSAPRVVRITDAEFVL